jgi:hypothetical protein
VLFISKLNKIRFFKAPAMVEMFAGMTWKEWKKLLKTKNKPIWNN